MWTLLSGIWSLQPLVLVGRVSGAVALGSLSNGIVMGAAFLANVRSILNRSVIM